MRFAAWITPLFSQYTVNAHTSAVLITLKDYPRRFSGEMLLRTSNWTCAYSCPVPVGRSSFVLWNLLDWTKPLCRFELPAVALKHSKATVIPNSAPSMLDHASSLEHHLVHDRPETTAFGRMSHRGIRFIKRVLPNHAQQVHRQSCKLAHQGVGVKLARGQSLQVHVGLELRMKLLMREVIVIQGNDVSRAELGWQRGRPTFQYVLGQQQNNTTQRLSMVRSVRR